MMPAATTTRPLQAVRQQMPAAWVAPAGDGRHEEHTGRNERGGNPRNGKLHVPDASQVVRQQAARSIPKEPATSAR
jgi:hypothetical protein